MARRTDFQAAITYNGQAIKKAGVIGVKIDGVRLLYRDGNIVTRNDKVPPGLYKALTPTAIEKVKQLGDVEIYRHGLSFGQINGMLQRHDPEEGFFKCSDVYGIGEMDTRLFADGFDSLEKDSKRVKDLLRNAVLMGYEGLVIRTDTHWYRVKPEATADVYITGYFEQLDSKKQPKGILGGFETNWGKVTAFTQEMREELWIDPQSHVGKMMTVTYKERYHTGKFRYAVTFNHFRDDKEEESFDTEPPEQG